MALLIYFSIHMIGKNVLRMCTGGDGTEFLMGSQFSDEDRQT
jgi:hypothetical protein